MRIEPLDELLSVEQCRRSPSVHTRVGSEQMQVVKTHGCDDHWFTCEEIASRARGWDHARLKATCDVVKPWVHGSNRARHALPEVR